MSSLLLEQLLATATTNGERNALHDEIGNPSNWTPQQIKSWFDGSGRGMLKAAGRAVHRTVKSGDHGTGRTGVDLLNKNQGSTGLKYEQNPAGLRPEVIDGQ